MFTRNTAGHLNTHKALTQQRKPKTVLSTSITEKQESDSKLSSQLVTRELRKVLEHGKNLMEETEGQMDKRSNETGVNRQTTRGQRTPCAHPTNSTRVTVFLESPAIKSSSASA